MKIIESLLPYQDQLPKRDIAKLKVIVIHCTELPTLGMAREYGERVLYGDGTGNSGHYYIDRDGQVYQYVEDDRIAHHVVGHNEEAIGIEIVNEGRYPNWYSSQSQVPSQEYTDAQLEALKSLLQLLKSRYPQIMQIARHSDLDTRTIQARDDPSVQIQRKVDPGPLFPWEEIQNCWNSL